MPTVRYDSAGAEWRAHWPLVFIATIGMILAASSTNTIGVMIPSIEKEFGWTRAEISSGPMILSVVGILFSTAAGYAIDRLGARKVGIAVAFAMTGSLALMGTATSNIWYWWTLWGVFGMAGAATSAVWLAPLSTLFVKGRGYALAVCMTGTGISSAVVPPLCYYFVEKGQWRLGFVAVGLGIAVILIPFVLLFWRGAEEFNVAAETLPIDGVPIADVLPGASVREGLTSIEFYKMFGGYVFTLFGSVGIVMNIFPVLTFTGIAERQAAAVAGVLGLSSIVGRFAGGWLLSRVSAKWLTVFPTILLTLLPIGLLIAPGSVPVAYAVCGFTAFMGGVKFPCLVYLVTEYFGPKSFGTLWGTLSIAGAVGVGIGPLVANYTYDVTRSYVPVLWGSIPFVLIAAGLYASLGKPRDYSQGESATVPA
jgi:MFS family permease